MTLQTIILAAGKGTRMRSSIPKVLHRLGADPLLGHVYRTAATLKSDAIYIVIGHEAEAVKNSFSFEPIHWILQDRQLGTGHAVQQVREHIRDDATVLVLYGDVPLLASATLQKLLDKVRSDTLALLTVRLDNPLGYGRIIRNPQGKVLAIVEEKDASDAQKNIAEVNTGVLAVQGKPLRHWLNGLGNDNAQGEFYLTDIIASAVRDGFSVETLETPDPYEVLGVNNREQLACLERQLQHRQAAWLMEQGVSFRDPARFDLRGEVAACGQDVEIDVNVLMEGRITLGHRVRVGAGVHLKNVTVEDDTEILAYSVLEDAHVGAGSRIGPYARLRPGTVLEGGVHIGNFVELKAANVGHGSKINHLSYVGDSSVGSGVNVGAGTITCNYDGANKHRTVIEDGAFIGSNSQLVAPVTIGRNATIGAGSTITRDAPADQLTLSRSRQLTVSGWVRPIKQVKK
jgi:bifunctional UDP-N-acetylglucosamine pyrophosphorylase/glucosamine-1-phosphate N-acetyltransferase